MEKRSAEAQAKFERWHERQFELGACRCPGCRARRDGKVEAAVAVSAAPVVSDVAVRDAADEREAATAAPLPAERWDFRPEEFGSPGFRVWEQHLKRACSAGAGTYGPPATPDAAERSATYWAKLQALNRDGLVDERDRAVQHAKDMEARAAEVAIERSVQLQRYADRVKEQQKQAAHAKLTYEEARASLEKAFGHWPVTQAIERLEKLLSFRKDLDKIGEQAEAVRELVCDAHDEAEAVEDSIKRLREKLDGEDDGE